MSMSLPEFYALMENDLTVELVDELFIQYYIEADDSIGFKILKHELLSSPHLGFWKPLLEQCFRAFESGDYSICVPSLILILALGILRNFHHRRTQ